MERAARLKKIKIWATQLNLDFRETMNALAIFGKC